MRALDRRQGAQLLAVVLICGGVLLLVLRLLGAERAGNFWPFFVLVPGVAMVVAAMTGSGREAQALGSAGGVVTGTGLVLLVQALTDYFQSWAYAWTLLPLFAGAALMLVARRGGDRAAVERGLRMVGWGAVAFVAFGALFEGAIFHTFLFNVGGGFVLPIVLIAIGALLLYSRGWPLVGHGTGDGASGSKESPKGPPAPA